MDLSFIWDFLFYPFPCCMRDYVKWGMSSQEGPWLDSHDHNNIWFCQIQKCRTTVKFYTWCITKKTNFASVTFFVRTNYIFDREIFIRDAEFKEQSTKLSTLYSPLTEDEMRDERCIIEVRWWWYKQGQLSKDSSNWYCAENQISVESMSFWPLIIYQRY